MDRKEWLVRKVTLVTLAHKGRKESRGRRDSLVLVVVLGVVVVVVVVVAQ